MNINNLKYLTVILISIVFVGCEKWLDVRPESELNEDQIFETEQGCMDALYGVYVNMSKTSAYGGIIPVTMDAACGLFDISDNANPFATIINHDYENEKSVSILDDIWLKLYYCIGLTNNILNHIDLEKSKTYTNHDYIKGEALALRAYLHYDLLRMYAPNIKYNPDYISIPYKRLFSDDIEPQLTVKEVIKNIITDLNEAKDLLKNDVIITQDPKWIGANTAKEEEDDIDKKNDKFYVEDFLLDRKYRMNYYAVLGTLARVHIDRGNTEDKELAYKYAMEIINSGKFRPIQEKDILVEDTDLRDVLFSDEIVFGLYSKQINSYFEKYFEMSSGFDTRLIMASNIRSDIFEGQSDDYRLKYQFKNQYNYYYYLDKHNEDYDYNKELTRLLTLSEIYYIASEARPSEAPVLMKSIMKSKNVMCSLTASSSTDEIMTEIAQEYRKEFLGEGQYFFTYKRLCYEAYMENLSQGLNTEDKTLTFPLPQDEISYGKRVSEIWK